MIEVFVGKGKQEQIFTIHKDLFTVFSKLAPSRVDPMPTKETERIELPNEEPHLFTEFVCWMYYGSFLRSNELKTDTREEQLWVLGHTLDAPAFQNFVMRSIHNDYATDKNHWMTPDSLTSIYGVTTKGMKLRKLTADIINAHEPCGKNRSGELGTSDYRNKWKELRAAYPELDEDVKKETSEAWSKKDRPWHKRFLGRYLEESDSLEAAWASQIKRARTKDDIEKTAKEKEVLSMFEGTHLGYEVPKMEKKK